MISVTTHLPIYRRQVDTELPAAAALADAAANPTTPTIGAGALLWNGAGWDRVRGDITNGIDVDVTRVQGTVTIDSELPAARAAADTLSNPTPPDVLANLLGFNGSTWDRWRNNAEVALLASAARTATTGFGEQTNYNAPGILLMVEVSSNPGGGETLRVEAAQRGPGGNQLTIGTATASTFGGGGGPQSLLIYPGTTVGATANGSAIVNSAIPRRWAGQVVHSGAGSWTYSVTLWYIL